MNGNNVKCNIGHKNEDYDFEYVMKVSNTHILFSIGYFKLLFFLNIS